MKCWIIGNLVPPLLHHNRDSNFWKLHEKKKWKKTSFNYFFTLENDFVMKKFDINVYIYYVYTQEVFLEFFSSTLWAKIRHQQIPYKWTPLFILCFFFFIYIYILCPFLDPCLQYPPQTLTIVQCRNLAGPQTQW